jgi:hypothetical protein
MGCNDFVKSHWCEGRIGWSWRNWRKDFFQTINLEFQRTRRCVCIAKQKLLERTFSILNRSSVKFCLYRQVESLIICASNFGKKLCLPKTNRAKLWISAHSLQLDVKRPTDRDIKSAFTCGRYRTTPQWGGGRGQCDAVRCRTKPCDVVRHLMASFDVAWRHPVRYDVIRCRMKQRTLIFAKYLLNYMHSRLYNRRKSDKTRGLSHSA